MNIAFNHFWGKPISFDLLNLRLSESILNPTKKHLTQKYFLILITKIVTKKSLII